MGFKGLQGAINRERPACPPVCLSRFLAECRRAGVRPWVAIDVASLVHNKLIKTKSILEYLFLESAPHDKAVDALYSVLRKMGIAKIVAYDDCDVELSQPLPGPMKIIPRHRVWMSRLEPKETSERAKGEECIEFLKSSYILKKGKKSHGALHFMRYVYRNSVVKNADEVVFTEDNSDERIIKDADLNPGCIIISSDTDFVVARNACVLSPILFISVLKRARFIKSIGKPRDEAMMYGRIKSFLLNCDVMTRDLLRVLFNLREDDAPPKSEIKQVIDCTRGIKGSRGKSMTVSAFLSKFEIDESPFLNVAEHIKHIQDLSFVSSLPSGMSQKTILFTKPNVFFPYQFTTDTLDIAYEMISRTETIKYELSIRLSDKGEALYKKCLIFVPLFSSKNMYGYTKLTLDSKFYCGFRVLKLGRGVNGGGVKRSSECGSTGEGCCDISVNWPNYKKKIEETVHTYPINLCKKLLGLGKREMVALLSSSVLHGIPAEAVKSLVPVMLDITKMLLDYKNGKRAISTESLRSNKYFTLSKNTAGSHVLYCVLTLALLGSLDIFDFRLDKDNKAKADNGKKKKEKFVYRDTFLLAVTRYLCLYLCSFSGCDICFPSHAEAYEWILKKCGGNKICLSNEVRELYESMGCVFETMLMIRKAILSLYHIDTAETLERLREEAESLAVDENGKKKMTKKTKVGKTLLPPQPVGDGLMWLISCVEEVGKTCSPFTIINSIISKRDTHPSLNSCEEQVRTLKMDKILKCCVLSTQLVKSPERRNNINDITLVDNVFKKLLSFILLVRQHKTQKNIEYNNLLRKIVFPMDFVNKWAMLPYSSMKISDLLYENIKLPSSHSAVKGDINGNNLEDFKDGVHQQALSIDTLISTRESLINLRDLVVFVFEMDEFSSYYDPLTHNLAPIAYNAHFLYETSSSFEAPIIPLDPSVGIIRMLETLPLKYKFQLNRRESSVAVVAPFIIDVNIIISQIEKVIGK